MSEPLHSNELRQSLVEELVAEYRRRRAAGEKVERKAFLLRYPYVAEALQVEFDNVDRDLQTQTPAVGKTSESGSHPGLAAGQSLRSSETVAPRGIGDSVAALSGPFPNLPAAFGRYHVEKLLGSGMMGAVYLARDPQLDRLAPTRTIGSRPKAKILSVSGPENSHSAVQNQPAGFGNWSSNLRVSSSYLLGEDCS